MNGGIQHVLLAAYRLFRRSGLLDTGIGRWGFETAYDLYKELLEARQAQRLRAFVKPGTMVIDVGANVGFFTIRFAEWTGKAGRVLAIEPEEVNVRRLRRRISRKGLDPVVTIIPAAAAATSGTAKLMIDPDHPGNHHLAEDGVSVTTVTVDGVSSEYGSLPVSLIKIDVQGAEEDVIAGAAETLRRFRPALFVEVDLRALAAMGRTPDGLLERLERCGYRIHRLDAGGPTSPISREDLLARLSDGPGYGDFLFLDSGTDHP